ncbi:DUF3369 domain-containing protein [Vibrio sp. ZSDE26]|uniref:DUF3369 domain-containing protein n=1 Tax=Vibrio amylolyticus TaxID=2847292 RepID=A0A9X1XKZ5_9VIBR|nr:DUF3369 domain-containing protein [Vibrio amylolyticus]MCK6263653.1 DUF3369 domain-containing protein [Vibrio amylolyticus]
MQLFADRRDETCSTDDTNVVVHSVKPWRLLLVDDDKQMHQITRLALGSFKFQNRPLEILSAMSAEEAKKLLVEEQDIALALVDVVMETEHAGLELIKHIREVENNHLIRLVLRTGQAGQAPEDTVIQEYEIDDYKEKTELTTQKLKTLLYSMLRSYRDLCLIEDQKKGLSRVIKASAKVQNTCSLQEYASSVLSQLTSLLKLEESAFYCVVQPGPEAEASRALTLAATGGYVNFYYECVLDKLPKIVSERCHQVLRTKETARFDDAFVLYTYTDEGADSLLYVNLNRTLDTLDEKLLEIYMRNISLSFENLNLLIDLRETSKELVHNLANAVEARSKETGAHVQRVSLISGRLAELYGLPKRQVTLIKDASPLHDIGKVAIPDRILHKPGKLDAEEWVIMKKHVEFGVEILSSSKRKLILTGKEIACAHHEKWDGTGYPANLSGLDIPVSGRIVALADVFDALGARRSYKEPWPDEDIKQELILQKGKHFEPKLVDLMLDNWNDFIQIRNELPD